MNWKKNWKKNWRKKWKKKEGRKEGNGKGREKKTDSQPNPEPSLGESEILRSFWMEGVVASYAIPATLLSPVSFALC